jgi:hypothetical protein
MPKGHYQREVIRHSPPQRPAEVASSPSPRPQTPAVEKKPIPAAAKAISSAPTDGTIVWLYNEQITHGIRGMFRVTRQCIPQGGYSKWVANAFWADPTTKKPLGAEWTHWLPL